MIIRIIAVTSILLFVMNKYKLTHKDWKFWAVLFGTNLAFNLVF